EPPGEGVGDDAGRTADVEQRGVAPTFYIGSEQISALHRVVALFRLNGPRIDQPAVEGTDQRTIGAGVKIAIGRGGHHGIEKHQAAPAAAGRARRVAIPIAMRQADKYPAATEVAAFHPGFWLHSEVEIERRDSLRARARADG